MNKLSGVFDLGVYKSTGELVRHIHKCNFDTLSGRLNTSLGGQCYSLDALYRTFHTDEIDGIMSNGLFKIPIYPNEALFGINTISFDTPEELSSSRFAVSYDNGVTWYTFDGSTSSAVTFADMSELLLNGMTLDQIESMTMVDHRDLYTDHIIVAMAVPSTDIFSGFTSRVDYDPTRIDSSSVRWIGETLNWDDYTFEYTPVSVNKTTVGDVTTYEIQYSNIAGAATKYINTIFSVCNSGNWIATFANVDITVEIDEMVIGSYEITINSTFDQAAQKTNNAENMLVQTTSPSYTDSVFGGSVCNVASMYMLMPHGANGPAANKSIFPASPDKTFRQENLDRVLILPSSRELDHTYVDPLESPTSVGNINITSSDTEGYTSGLSHYPAYLRFAMQADGNDVSVPYIPWLQHRPDTWATGSMASISSSSNVIVENQFLRRPSNGVRWYYILHYGIPVTEANVPVYSVNPFDDLIVDVYDTEIKLWQYESGEALFTLTSNINEEFKLAWCTLDDPSNHCMYIVTYNTDTSTTSVSSLPITFTLDSTDKSIAVVVNGDLTERYMHSNVSSPYNVNPPYYLGYNLELHTALAGPDSIANFLSSVETTPDKGFAAYAHIDYQGNTVVDGTSAVDQVWSNSDMSMGLIGGSTLGLGLGGEDTLEFDGTGHAYLAQNNPNVCKLTGRLSGNTIFANINPSVVQDSTVLQFNGVKISLDSGNNVSFNPVAKSVLDPTGSTYGYIAGGYTDYSKGWGGSWPTDINTWSDTTGRMSFATDTLLENSRATMSVPRAMPTEMTDGTSMWIVGGRQGISAEIEWDKLAFATDTVITNGTSGFSTAGSTYHYNLAGSSPSATYGYLDGRGGSYLDSYKVTFATDVAVNLPVSICAVAVSSTSNSGIYGCKCNTYNSKYIYTCTIDDGGNYGYERPTRNTMFSIATDTVVYTYNPGWSTWSVHLLRNEPRQLFGHTSWNTEENGWFVSDLGYNDAASASQWKTARHYVTKITYASDSFDWVSRASAGTTEHSHDGGSFNDLDDGYSFSPTDGWHYDLSNDTVSQTVRSTGSYDRAGAAGTSDNMIISTEPSVDPIIDTYVINSKSPIMIVESPNKSHATIITSTGVYTAGHAAEDIGTFSHINLGSTLTPSTGYDLIGDYVSENYFTGQLDNIIVRPTCADDSVHKHAPTLYNLSDVIAFEDTHSTESLFTFIVTWGMGLSSSHYFIDTNNNNLFTEITDLNRSQVTPVSITTLNSELDTIKLAVDSNTQSFGLIHYSMETTNSRHLSKTYAKVQIDIPDVHDTVKGMNSSGVYSEATDSVRIRGNVRLFGSNGRVYSAIISTKMYDLVSLVNNIYPISNLSGGQIFDAMNIARTEAGYNITVESMSSTVTQSNCLFIGDDDTFYLYKSEDDTSLTTHHVQRNAYDIWSGEWCIHGSITNADETISSHLSREHRTQTGGRLLCYPTRQWIGSGAIGAGIWVTTHTTIHFNPSGYAEFNYPDPTSSPGTYQYVASPSVPLVWGKLSWLFADGGTSPNFASGEIYNVILSDTQGIAVDNWQSTNLFTKMLYGVNGVNNHLFKDVALVNGRDILPGLYLGTPSEDTSGIETPTENDKFFLI